MDLSRAHGYDPVPQTTGLYAEASNRSQVFRLLLLAFIIQILAKWDVSAKTSGDIAKNAHRVTLATNAVGWITLWFILTMASDYSTTADLAIAFCWLILIAQLLLNGKMAMDHVGSLVTEHQPAQ